MAWKLPIPQKIKKIETKDKKEASLLKKLDFLKKAKNGKFVLEKNLKNGSILKKK